MTVSIRFCAMPYHVEEHGVDDGNSAAVLKELFIIDAELDVAAQVEFESRLRKQSIIL